MIYDAITTAPAHPGERIAQTLGAAVSETPATVTADRHGVVLTATLRTCDHVTFVQRNCG